MTIAIDRKTGAVVGQVVDIGAVSPLTGAWTISLLTGNGYRDVDAASVRLERTGD